MMAGFPEGLAPHLSSALAALVPAAAASLVALSVLLFAKPASPVSAPAARADAAIDAARGRLARDEIDAAEYHRLVTGLSRTA